MRSVASTSRSQKAFEDPSYDGYGLGEQGFSITKGTHHLNGAEALAYARIRKALGESDFTRAARQQQILVALADQATQRRQPPLRAARRCSTRSARPSPPTSRSTGSRTSRRSWTRWRRRRSRGPSSTTRSSTPKQTRYGDSQVPDLEAIQAMAAKLFSTPGTQAGAVADAEADAEARQPKPTGRSVGATGRAPIARSRLRPAPRTRAPRRRGAIRRAAPRAVRDRVLLGRRSTGPSVRPPGGSRGRLEDRVVAEPAGPARRRRDPAAAGPAGQR